MTDPKNEVLFCEYCKTCKHKLCDCEDEPCCDCLAAPVNYYSHKPVNWEGVDTLFNKPVERRDHAAERAVREALCLECNDIAEPLEVGSTPRHKINMKSILSEIAQMVKDKYGRDFTWEELTGLLKMFLSYDDQIMETNDDLSHSINDRYINANIENINWHGYERDLRKNIFANVVEVYLPNVKTIGSYTFYGCDRLRTLIAPRAERVESNVFGTSSNLVTVDLSSVTDMLALNGVSNCTTFSSCRNLKSVKIPKLLNLPKGMFEYCTSISESGIELSQDIESFPYNLFSYCSRLSSFSHPNVRTIDSKCFNECVNLVSVNFPNLETVGSSAFYNCSKLTTITIPKVKKIDSEAFYACNNLEYIDSLQSVEILGSRSFSKSGIKELTIPNIKTLSTEAFKSDNICMIDMSGIKEIPEVQTKTFDGIKSNCVIVVPAAFYQKICASALWESVIDRVEFRDTPMYVYTNIINGTVRANDSDGSDVSNRFITGVGHNLEFSFIGNDDTTTLFSATDNNDDILRDITYHPKSLLSRKYSVNNSLSSSIKYGFALNSNGYYESKNKGISSSYAFCGIDFEFERDTVVILKVINSGESTYDFGMFSKIDTNLYLRNDITYDAANIYWSGKNKNSTDVVDVTYTIPAGKHSIQVKFIKDSSGNSGNDSLQFKVTYADDGIIPAYYTYTLENIQEDHNINVVFGEAETSET